MSGESNYTFAKGMAIDTHICTVDNREFTFGDCLRLVSESKKYLARISRLEEEVESLENQLIELGEHE